MGSKSFHIGKEEIVSEGVHIAFKTNHESGNAG